MRSYDSAIELGVVVQPVMMGWNEEPGVPGIGGFRLH